MEFCLDLVSADIEGFFECCFCLGMFATEFAHAFWGEVCLSAGLCDISMVHEVFEEQSELRFGGELDSYEGLKIGRHREKTLLDHLLLQNAG